MSFSPISNVSCFEISNLNDTSSKSSYLTANILTVVVLALGFHHIYNKRKTNTTIKSVINNLPGPFALPLIGNCHLILGEKDLISFSLKKALEYGPILRFFVGHIPIVLLNSPTFVEKLLSSNNPGHLRKSEKIYEGLTDYLDEGLITSNGETWRARRKLLAPLFNYKCFYNFIDIFNRHSKDLAGELDNMFQKGDNKSKPIQNALLGGALKVICEAAMGVDVSVSSAAEFDTFFDDASICKEYCKKKILSPWFRLKIIWKLHPFSKAYEANVKAIKDFMYKVIYQARDKFSHKEENDGSLTNGTAQNKTVMEVLLESGLSNAGIREEAHTLISAGHETIASTLQFALMLLALHPEHQAQCQEEVDVVINDETKCPQGDFTLSALSDLKYIERCVKETLRIYPIAFGFGRSLKAPLELDEKITLPSGINVLIMATNIHRNPKYYPEPDKFDPSRFTPENCVNRHPYAYLPFSGGPRYCLGAKFAVAELKLILARILYHFNIYTTDKIEDIPLESSILLNPVRGYNFRLEKRNEIPQ